MTLEDFVKTYDKEGAVVLLEGKRIVIPSEEQKLFDLGKLLATVTDKMLFRSGNAEGSDYLFSQGVASVDSKRLHVITPYAGHRKKYNSAAETYSLEDINLLEEPEVISQSKQSKGTSNLIDLYVSGKKGRSAIKAAYLIRDTVKVIGSEKIPPATFSIFYDNLKDPHSGGTGHTMLICELNNVPYIDQKVWMSWV